MRKRILVVMLDRWVYCEWMRVVGRVVLEGGDGAIGVERITGRGRWGSDGGLSGRYKRVLARPSGLVVVGGELVGDAWRLLWIIHPNHCDA